MESLLLTTGLYYAQIVGIVEIYQLEVIFSSSKVVFPQKTPQDGILCGALLNIVQSVQRMIGEISNTYQEKPLCEFQASEKGSSQSKTRLCDEGNECAEFHESPHQVKDFIQSQQESDCMSSHLNQVEHCGGQSGDCLSPQHPTTKETEAANVLMNLSGKADRIIHGRLETSIHSKVLSELDHKSTVFLLPTSGSPTSKLDLNIKREHSIVCDEVPQINEKDLLPLATQVLCQFCSKQCEDLVELHEHVLALHNVPDGELPLMSSTKRLKNSCEEERLEVEGTLCPLTTSKTKKDVLIHNSGSSLKTVVFTKNQLLDGRVMGESEKYKNASPLVSSCISQENNDLALLHHSENKSKNSILSHDTVKTFQVIVPPRGVGKSYELESFLLEQQQIQTVTVKSEKENQNQQRHGDEVAVNLPMADTSKHTVVANDVLAIAVEPLQIKSIEAKVTIFVCLKCSWSYTHSHEFKNHKCSGDQPFIKTCVDGSVVLVDSPSAEEDHLQPSNYNIWYFPEFLIRQRSKRAKEGSQNLEIVHCGSGRKLQLFTSYQPSYLGDQFISFRCPICEKDYDSLDHFLEHLVTGPCMFRCPECSLVYKNQDKLQSHRTSMHPNIEDRTCPNCKMVFEKRHQRNKHLKTQCSENHTCGVCGRVLKNEYNLQVHMQSHKEREHVCKECGDAFYRRTILLRHMMRHSGTRPHACTLCSAKFFTRQHLNIHLDRHNNFKRYPCSECSKAYFSKYDRDSHYMKIHNKGSAGHKLPVAKDESVNKPQVE
ncbi:zinc finger protein 41-like isoform X2 [Macrobrachium rosenbergii]|uniref:zinc finger protein 41-like isoform X2 n=1 Tax=Macrobrachium rosenbergii TaxID=79674 RepID=UPI0034D401B8